MTNTEPELKAFKRAPSLGLSQSGFEDFLIATSVPAADDAVAPTEPPAVAVRNVFELAATYGIHFGN